MAVKRKSRKFIIGEIVLIPMGGRATIIRETAFSVFVEPEGQSKVIEFQKHEVRKLAPGQ